MGVRLLLSKRRGQCDRRCREYHAGERHQVTDRAGGFRREAWHAGMVAEVKRGAED
jgi:hypothetical protein